MIPAGSPFVLAVCGLAAETRVASGPSIRTVAGGGDAKALALAIEREIAHGAVGIVSFGVAGALIPALRPGALIVAKAIISANGSWPVDERWSKAIAARLSDAISASIAGHDTIVPNPASKTSLQERTGASAVDMESHIAARIAAAHGLPFVALRAITDPLDRTLPPAALVAMRPGGAIDLPKVLRSIALSPRQLPQLLQIARDTKSALDALGHGRRALGRGLGYLDLDQLLVHVI